MQVDTLFLGVMIAVISFLVVVWPFINGVTSRAGTAYGYRFGKR